MKRFLFGLYLSFFVAASSEVGAFSEKDLAKLKATNDCVKCDLSGADLSGAKLSGAILFGVNLSRANLTGADLSRSGVYEADLTWANLYEANLTGTLLAGTNLDWATLTRADLTGADLTDASLYGANLTGANLYQANLRWAGLMKTNLTGANLSEANLTGASLNDIRIDEKAMSTNRDSIEKRLAKAGEKPVAKKMKGKKEDLWKLWDTNECLNCDLQGANLKRGYLNGADLSGANLRGATLWNADLEGANLSGTDLTCTNLADANLSGADLRGAIIRGTNLFNTGVDLPETTEEYQYRDDYSFTQEPFVSPLLLYEMASPAMWQPYGEEWDGENFETVVNLPDANNTGERGCFRLDSTIARYTVEDSDDWVVGSPWDWQNIGEGGAFGYKQIGKTEFGLYVLLAGTWIETTRDLDILLVRLERASFTKVEVGRHDPKLPRLTKYPRFLLKLVGMINGVAESVHQFKGEVSVKGNKLHIVKPRQYWVESGEQEMVIDLETMEYEKDEKGMLLDTLLSTKKCQGCNLTGVNLNGTDLIGVNLTGANLSWSDLRDADLSKANLTGADLMGARLWGVNLHGANLTGANLHGANLDLDGFNLARANLEGTIFCKTIMLDGTINNSDC